jgi:hypothetical protein
MGKFYFPIPKQNLPASALFFWGGSPRRPQARPGTRGPFQNHAPRGDFVPFTLKTEVHAVAPSVTKTALLRLLGILTSPLNPLRGAFSCLASSFGFRAAALAEQESTPESERPPLSAHPAGAICLQKHLGSQRPKKIENRGPTKDLRNAQSTLTKSRVRSGVLTVTK